jgi:glycosyltransferase involved in cell wall biosynthesis
MHTRIGYLIPEFPGQTHVFIWRERRHLARLGVETCLISTRPPPREIVSHAWAGDAAAQTAYLAPFSGKDVLLALFDLLRAGPGAWWRCFRAARRATGLSFQQRLRLLAMSTAAAKLVRIARRQDWSHVHVHSCADAAHVAMLASLISPLTYSLTFHGPELATYGPNQPEKWRHARFALVVSKRCRVEAEQALAGSLPPYVETAPMGVDVDQIRRTAGYVPWNGTGPLRTFSSGRLNVIKGHADLVEAVRQLRQRGIDARLRIAGEDEFGGRGYRQELSQLIRDKGLTDAITLLGAISEEQIRTELEDAHVFALASLNEGVSVAIMEAMAMQSPAVVTDVGGARELIEDGRTGLLVPAKDPAAMADRIERLARDPTLAKSISDASRELIARAYHDRRSADALTQALGRTFGHNV